MEDTQTAMQHDKESQERQIRLAIYQEVVRNNDAQSLSQVLAQCEAVEEWVLLGNEPDTVAPRDCTCNKVSETITDPGEASDGYHTFNELYDARHALFLNLCLSMRKFAFWTHKNYEGETLDGWFILGIEGHSQANPKEQITFHLPCSLLPLVKGAVPEKERNTGFDGHVTAEATARLYGLANRTAMDVRSTPLEKAEHSEFYNDSGEVIEPIFDDKNYGVVVVDVKLNPGS